jgi:threonine synthase
MHELIAARLTCPGCGLYFNDRVLHSDCTNCGALLDLDVNTELKGPQLAKLFAQRSWQQVESERSGVWRYRELVLPTVAEHEVVTFPEGNTPLIASKPLAEFAGLRSLNLKHEGMNPTGSFKDRGMTVAITQAKRIGARAVACASTGNTSASLAAYAARAELPAIVLIPSGKISTGKLAQTLAHGAKTIAVRGSFDDCLRLLREASEQLGVYVVNSVNPFRLAGQRTIVFETLHQLGWQAPDWIALPAGNLGNTSAFGDALRLARQAGLINKVPRLLAVQAAGAAPFAHAFATHFGRGKHETVANPETVATAIRIGAPASWDRAVRAIEETRGVVMAVTDDEILDAKRAIDRAGVGCEPASAASLAGIRKLRAGGGMDSHERVVAVLTGHLLKDPAAIIDQDSSPVEIEASVASLRHAMETMND